MPKEDDNKVTIQSAPDPMVMAQMSTNKAILEFALKNIPSFQKNFAKTMLAYGSFGSSIAFAMVLKNLLESKVVEKFSITDFDFVNYYWQKVVYRHPEQTYEIIKVGEKWVYKDKIMSSGALSTALEAKQIFMNQPGSYYFRSWDSKMVVVDVTSDRILIKAPALTRITDSLDQIMKSCEVIVQNSSTIMVRCTMSPTEMVNVTPQSPTYSFETTNYRMLKNLIKSNFRMSKTMKFRKIPLSIIFDGEPGMGKTTFCNFMAGTGEADFIMLINLVQFKSLEFKEIVSKISKRINDQMKNVKATTEQTIIIQFDEIDKYFESYMEDHIMKIQDDARGKKEIKKGEGDKTEEIITKSDKLTDEEIAAKKKHILNNFLNYLYEVCEGLSVLGSDRYYVIIYNSNHFDKLFNKDTDVRYQALYKRFHKFHFSKIGKSDVIDFVKDLCEKTIKSETEARLKAEADFVKYEGLNMDDYNISDEELDKIPSDIKISYRDISQILETCSYNMIKFVKLLQNKNTWAGDGIFYLNDDEKKDGVPAPAQVVATVPVVVDAPVIKEVVNV